MTTTQKPPNMEVVNRAREVTQQSIAPRAARYDAEVLSPAESWHDLWHEGLLSMTIPQEYGGLDLDALTYAMALEEIAQGCTNTAMTLHMHSTVQRFISHLATPEQQARFYPEVVRHGKLFGSWAAERGTSFTRAPFVTVAAHRTDNGYRISGQKTFCTMAEAASYYMVWCTAEGSEDIARSMTLAVVPADTPGMTVVGEWNTLGMRGTVSPAVQFDDCLITEDMVLGKPGEPLGVGVVEFFSLGYSAIFLGAAWGALQHATNYCIEARYLPDPQPISHDPATQRDVANIAIHLEAARLMLHHCASQWGEADTVTRGLLASKTKYLSTEAATMATQEALRLVGGRAASKSFPIERAFRDVHTCTLMPPSVNTMLGNIGKSQFGLLRAMYMADEG